MGYEILKFNNGIEGLIRRVDPSDFKEGSIMTESGEASCQAFQMIEPSSVTAIYYYVLTCNEPESLDTSEELKRAVVRIRMLDQARTELVQRIETGKVASAHQPIDNEAMHLSPAFGPGYYGMDTLATKVICDSLRANEIGVSVNEFGAVLPASSVCGIIIDCSTELPEFSTSCETCRGNEQGCSLCNNNFAKGL